ncbi:MAG: sigma-54-dependent Fis family transcriptional regulator [Candidatus Aminicenantes bacterium]|nr:MAG: sigma-54-dependent Fis family transcriptional regulator [Candidatus Aminicenantes bacterium]
MKKVLIIDDELAMADVSKNFETKYGAAGYIFLYAKDRNTALQTLAVEKDISLILLDINFYNMNETDGFEVIKKISKDIWPGGQKILSGKEYGLPMLLELKRNYADIPVVMLSEKRVPDILLWCWKNGACYYIMKPPESKSIFKKHLDTFSRYSSARLLIGNSDAMKIVKEQIALASENGSSVSVLILGESGTGKELIARSIHEAGCRKDKPFIVVNCAAIPGNLMESELFGHKKGSFTGAVSDKKGKFQEADGGLIFLDEIGELSLELQAKMLRIMARGMTFSPVGTAKEITCDVQIVAATNKNLEQAVKEGRFREDLYYRLNVFPIEAPPLRERKEDIIILAEHFLKTFKSNQYQSKTHVSGFSEGVINFLNQYQWPGNVRELENVVEYALVRTTGNIIETRVLPEKVRRTFKQTTDFKIDFNANFNIKAYIDNIRWEIIKKAFEIEHVNGKNGLIERIANRIGLPNPSDIQRTILPQIKESCPELEQEIELLLPSSKRKPNKN